MLLLAVCARAWPHACFQDARDSIVSVWRYRLIGRWRTQFNPSRTAPRCDALYVRVSVRIRGCGCLRASSACGCACMHFRSVSSQVSRRGVALAMNINAGKGLQEVLRSNLGPRGTLKMCAPGSALPCRSPSCTWSWGSHPAHTTPVQLQYDAPHMTHARVARLGLSDSHGAIHTTILQHRLVGGSGDVKLTKDGNTLLHEMVRARAHTSTHQVTCISRVTRQVACFAPHAMLYAVAANPAPDRGDDRAHSHSTRRHLRGRCADTHARLHTYTRTRTLAHEHTRPCAHTRARTHTHTQAPPRPSS